MLSQVLQDNGFTEKEAKIYLAALELSNAPASSIARYASENRITVYTILKDLCKKWIANEMTKNKIKYYTVLEPNQLMQLHETKARRLKESLPELLAIVNKGGTKPKVYFYEWLEGLKRGYEDVLSSKGTIYALLWVQHIEPKLKEYLDNEYIPKRVKAKVFAKVIVPYSKDNAEYAKKDKTSFRKTLMIKEKIFAMESEINLYGKNKVLIAMFSKNEMSGLIIESKNLYNSLKTIFELLWIKYES